MFKHAFGVLTVAVFVVGLASLSVSAATPTRGVVSGTAVPCTGPMYMPTAHLFVFQGTDLVGTGQFRTGSTFRFSLRPGRYLITNNRAYPRVGTSFRIRGSRLTHVIMVDACE
jgi:hypothetical protein